MSWMRLAEWFDVGEASATGASATEVPAAEACARRVVQWISVDWKKCVMEWSSGRQCGREASMGESWIVGEDEVQAGCKCTWDNLGDRMHVMSKRNCLGDEANSLDKT